MLRGYSKQEVARKRAALLDYRHLFTFNEKPTFPVAASDVVVELMCTYAKHSKRRRRRAIVGTPANTSRLLVSAWVALSGVAHCEGAGGEQMYPESAV